MEENKVLTLNTITDGLGDIWSESDATKKNKNRVFHKNIGNSSQTWDCGFSHSINPSDSENVKSPCLIILKISQKWSNFDLLIP